MNNNKAKLWLQDNMRIIISILIVALIAGGIYSYSKRAESPVALEETEEIGMIDEDAIIEEDSEVSEEVATQSENMQGSTPATQENVSSIATRQETENSFVETATSGDSKTTLARRALADFLEKNPDSALTAEHKIYIEDFLRKNVQHNESILVGTSVEFSKDLIKNAVERSKTLNERQLQNLHKYAIRVPSLS